MKVSVSFNEPKKLYVIFTIFLIIGLYLMIFVSFQQNFMSPYVLFAYSFFIFYFGLKGIFKTYQYTKNKKK